MTYTTTFDGVLTAEPPLQPAHRAYLDAFAATRRVRRDAGKTAARPDDVRNAVGLPVGEEGGYFVGAGGMLGQEGGGPLFDPGGLPAEQLGILDFNAPPAGQPHLWCGWQPTPDGCGLHIPEAGAHYDPLTWLRYLASHFLTPWGYRLKGAVTYCGDHASDTGRLVMQDGEPQVDSAQGRGPRSEGWSARERGEALFAQQRWQEALAEFQRAVAQSPGWPDPWWLQGMTLDRLGRHDECFASLDRAIVLDDDPAQREARRAKLHGLLRRAGRVAEGLERARALRADSRFDEAILEYQAMLKAIPQDRKFGEEWVTAMMGIGLCEQGAQRYDRALAVYFEAGESAPQDPSGWTYMAYLQAYQLNQPREAITTFQLAIGAGNDGSPIYNELGMACGRCGMNEEARDAFIEATNADPDDPLPWFNLGHSFLALAEYRDALGCFERAASFNDPRCHAAALNGIAEARQRMSGLGGG